MKSKTYCGRHERNYGSGAVLWAVSEPRMKRPGRALQADGDPQALALFRPLDQQDILRWAGSYCDRSPPANVNYRDFRLCHRFDLQLGLYASPLGFSAIVVPENQQILYDRWRFAGAFSADKRASISEC